MGSVPAAIGVVQAIEGSRVGKTMAGRKVRPSYGPGALAIRGKRARTGAQAHGARWRGLARIRERSFAGGAYLKPPWNVHALSGIGARQ